MSKISLRELVMGPTIGIKSFLIELSKKYQKKGILTGFLLSLLLFSVLSSVAQFHLFRANAILDKSNGNSLTDSSRVYNQTKLDSDPSVNLSSHILPKQSVLNDSLNKNLSGDLSTNLAFKGAEIERNVNTNTITASNIANVTDKNTQSLINTNTITASNIANVTDKNTQSLINTNTITASNIANVTDKGIVPLIN
ncbi:MAG TPA: hypothetical protein VL854_00290, partial [Nitrososphaeraceae archaeon]|nr:hypothetical protein [Nitrososphaeraceae archaeon]